LITPEDQDGNGVDRLLVVSSAAEPLRVLLAGLVHDVSLASARQAVGTTYARVQDVIALEQGEAGRRTAGAQVDAILHSEADVILLVGGTDGGAAEPMIEMAREVVRVALYLMGEDAPAVLYAGNQVLAQELTDLFQEVTQVQVTANVRPRVDIQDCAPAAQELNAFYYEHKMRALPGLRTIRNWVHSLILPTARATETAIRCCEQVFETGKPALGVDLGSASVVLHVADQEQVQTTVRTDLGVGESLLGLLDQVEIDQILRWLPFELSETAFLDWFYHKAQHPQTLPQTRHELLIEQAVARELLRAACNADMTPACAPLIGSGSQLSRAPHPGQAALILLDGLQPLGVSTLYQDEGGLLPAVGSVARIEPLAAVQVLQNDGLLYLGTVVAPQGAARPGARALTVRSLDPEVEIDQPVRYGELCLLSPLLRGSAPEAPLLELIPARGFDLGRGPGKSIRVPFEPGALGLIIDARGRPLALAREAEARREQMDEWLYNMTGERGT
jgi:hypothetical protein